MRIYTSNSNWSIKTQMTLLISSRIKSKTMNNISSKMNTRRNMTMKRLSKISKRFRTMIATPVLGRWQTKLRTMINLLQWRCRSKTLVCSIRLKVPLDIKPVNRRTWECNLVLHHLEGLDLPLGATMMALPISNLLIWKVWTITKSRFRRPKKITQLWNTMKKLGVMTKWSAHQNILKPS